MKHPLSRWLTIGMFCLFLSGISVLAATKPIQPNLQGRWVVREEMCTLLCGFILINGSNDNTDNMRLQFDSGEWSKKASGPFVHVKDNQYELSGGGAKIPFNLHQGTLVTQSGTTYVRVSLYTD